MQSRHANYAYVDVEMFMLLAMRPVRDRLRRAFKMNSKTVTTDAGIKRLVAEVQVESELLLVISYGSGKIVHQKLRCDPGKLCDTGKGGCCHVYSCPLRVRPTAGHHSLAQTCVTGVLDENHSMPV